MPLLSFFLWFALIWSAGWLSFPFSRRIFGAVLPDGGLAVGRVLFLAVWTMGAFWAGNFGVSTQNSVFIGVGLAILGLLFLIRHKREIEKETRARRSAIWASEAAFVLVFLAFFVLRGFWSDTSGTNGEKSMDSALIGSLVRAERLPPPNPYAAGAALRSYYYFGHLQTALLSCATRTPVRGTYNWQCATLPALCFSTLFSLGAALTKRLRGGLLVAASVLGLGTLQPIYQWLYFYQWLRPEKFRPNVPFHLDFFAVSRVIPYSINEFPFFTFNQSDLHAHYFGMPLALATLCLALALFRGQKAAIWPATLVLGAQILTNTWDFPAYALVLALAITAPKSATAARKATENEATDAQVERPNGWNWPVRLGILVLVWVGALLLAAPYLAGIKTAASPPKWLGFPASPMREWGLLWGVFAASWLAFLAYSGEEPREWRWFCGGFGALFGFYALAVVWEDPNPFVLPLIVCLLGFSIYGAFQRRGNARFLCFLAIAGLVALAWSETTWAGFLGSAADPTFKDFKRQDTVFKFGLQTWMLWGIAASCGAVTTFKRWPRALQLGLMPALGIMAMASTAAMFGRARNFEKWDGWDGWAHLSAGQKDAASWLLQNARPGENLLEAEQLEGGDYSTYARYASATGIPSVMGPQAHTFQWSPANSGDVSKEWDEVARRKATARALYRDWSGARRRDVLRDYGARFIIFGDLEREQYGSGALQSLLNDPLLRPVAVFDPSARSADVFGTPNAVWIFRSQ